MITDVKGTQNKSQNRIRNTVILFAYFFIVTTYLRNGPSFTNRYYILQKYLVENRLLNFAAFKNMLLKRSNIPLFSSKAGCAWELPLNARFLTLVLLKTLFCHAL